MPPVGFNLNLISKLRQNLYEVRTGGLCHGSRAEKLTHHESYYIINNKFYFEALHVSRETYAITQTREY